MNPPYWVTFEHGWWHVRPFARTTALTRCKGFWLRREAMRRVKRLRNMWSIWILTEAFRRIGKDTCSKAELDEACIRAIQFRNVRVGVLEIRRTARKLGLNPDDVITMDAEMVRTGPALSSLRQEDLDGPLVEPEVMITVGQRWMPLDPRRKYAFTIARIEGDTIHGSDGREVKASRLVKRYRPVEAP